jgi:hypothetical protein
MANYDHPAFTWIPDANQIARDASAAPSTWIDPVELTIPYSYAPAFGTGDGGGGGGECVITGYGYGHSG